jgi:hypothetical protein
MFTTIKNHLIIISSVIYLIILSFYTIGKITTIVALSLFTLLYSVNKATQLIENRNKYVKHIPKSFRLNLINYPGELRLPF